MVTALVLRIGIRGVVETVHRLLGSLCRDWFLGVYEAESGTFTLNSEPESSGLKGEPLGVEHFMHFPLET